MAYLQSRTDDAAAAAVNVPEAKMSERAIHPRPQPATLESNLMKCSMRNCECLFY